MRRKFRFESLVSSANTGTQITRGNLLNLLLVNLAGSTTNARLIAGIKVVRFEMWGLTNASSTQNLGTISIEWLSQFGPSLEVSDTAIPSIRPPYISSTPPPQSAASFWSLTGQNESEVLFQLSSSSGNIVDIVLDVILFDGESQVNVTTSASGNAGTLYMGYLSGPGNANGFMPISYLSIT